MINLFLNTFDHPNQARDKEFKEAFKRNEENDSIDRIVLVCENQRATYQDFMNAMRDYPDDVNIMCNADIFFDSTVEKLVDMNPHNAFAMTRYEWPSKKLFIHKGAFDSWWSQDTWIIKGAPPDDLIFKNKSHWWPFGLGVAGCDNHFAWLLWMVGYDVKNPCLSIHSYHLHSAGFNDREWHRKSTIGNPQVYK
ncbi:MAG: hypothetical protein KAR20_04395, partial [Candidatus Heimdallarchaeota archaeon]|nr:hypothetical protein [Candidatus Heimdallarchaeota archaeon]